MKMPAPTDFFNAVNLDRHGLPGGVTVVLSGLSSIAIIGGDLLFSVPLLMKINITGMNAQSKRFTKPRKYCKYMHVCMDRVSQTQDVQNRNLNLSARG